MNDDLIKYRLFNQQLSQCRFSTPAEIVSWMGAIQAQDYYGGKWAIGLRLPETSDKDIEMAIADGKIVRTWAMRGTLHFVAPEDVWWMLKLFGPKIIKGSAGQYRNLGLDEKTIVKSNRLISKRLEDGLPVTRTEIRDHLATHKIPVSDLRAGFLLQRAVYEQIMVFGPRKDKEFTFVSLPTTIREPASISRDESLNLLALRYFLSHGPATLPDFAWWAGLNQTDARKALDMAKPGLEEIVINDLSYWMSPDINCPKKTVPKAWLLPGFDEYMVAYKNRTHAAEDHHLKKIYGAGNGLFANTLMINGKIKGMWKRTLKKDTVLIEPEHFEDLSEKEIGLFVKARGEYVKFLGLEQGLL